MRWPIVSPANPWALALQAEVVQSATIHFVGKKKGCSEETLTEVFAKHLSRCGFGVVLLGKPAENVIGADIVLVRSWAKHPMPSHPGETLSLESERYRHISEKATGSAHKDARHKVTDGEPHSL